ncbi:MAG: hypothetical protein ACI9S8_001732 [Chlamydiales bacterium]|jgi:hypothetical protein
MSAESPESMSNLIPPDAIVEANQANLADAEAGSNTPNGEADEEGFKTVSFSALHRKAPEVYQATLQGITTTILNQMRRSNERIRKNIKGLP